MKSQAIAAIIAQNAAIRAAAQAEAERVRVAFGLPTPTQPK